MGSAHQPSSPESGHDDNDQHNARKRKRKTFSCDTCRRRKLKCDRELPVCGRCKKSGDAANCVYENPPEPASIKHGDAKPLSIVQLTEADLEGLSHQGSPSVGRQIFLAPAGLQTDRLAALESRIAQIDPRLSGGEPLSKRMKFDDTTSIDPSFTDKKQSISTSLYGGGFRTGFFGPSSERNAASYYPAMIKLFPELKPFVSFNNLQHPLFAQIRGHVFNLRKNSKLAKKMLSRAPAMSPLDILPDKETCARMATTYFETIGSTYHVFHAPTFWSNFWAHWLDTTQQSEATACIILLMLSCVHVTESRRAAKYRGLSNVVREEALWWIETCDAWTSRQSRKHLTIESFQIRILLVIAKQINAMKRKQIWERASELLVFAISTGLHQDPSKIDTTYVRDQAQDIPTKPKTTPYEREMRRRFWAAIVELELQSSIDKGVPPSRLALMADCGNVNNIADEQFEPSSSALPQSEHRSKHTVASYLHLSQETLALRASIASLINSGLDRVAFDELLAYDEQIQKALDQLPEWTKAQYRFSTAKTASSPTALLELQILQLRLLLHIPSARGMDKDSRSNFSRMTCIDTATRMLQIHHGLAGSIAWSDGVHWLNLIREDAFRGVVAISFNLVIWRGLSDQPSMLWMRDVHTPNAERGLELFRTKMYALGDHYVQMWYSLASLGMLRACFAIEDVDNQVRIVADDLNAIFSTVCNNQEEPSNEQTAAGALTALATPNSGGFDASTSTGMTPLPLPDFTTVAPFGDGSEFNSWGFDDLWPFSNTGLSW